MGEHAAVIGLIGERGSGKTAAIEELRRHLEDGLQTFESFHIVAEVAGDWLKRGFPARDVSQGALGSWHGRLEEILRESDHRSDRHVVIPEPDFSQPEHEKLLAYVSSPPDTPITAGTKEQHRPLLDWLGWQVAVNVDGYWYDNLLTRVERAVDEGAKFVIVGGVRFPADGDLLRARVDGIVCRVDRPRWQGERGMAESRLDEIRFEARLINDGTLRQLGAAACALVKNVSAGHVGTAELPHVYAAGSGWYEGGGR